MLSFYRWAFDSGNPTAHAVWLAFHDHQQTGYGAVKNSGHWEPFVVAGKAPATPSHVSIALALSFFHVFFFFNFPVRCEIAPKTPIFREKEPVTVPLEQPRRCYGAGTSSQAHFVPYARNEVDLVPLAG